VQAVGKGEHPALADDGELFGGLDRQVSLPFLWIEMPVKQISTLLESFNEM